jgi:AGZA family xanthine/uracil permease-like MFS transporter
MGVTKLPEAIATQGFTLAPTFMQMDFAGLLKVGNGVTFFGMFVSLLTVILSFTIVDMFDTIGTLIGTADKGGFLDKEGKLPRINQALMADAVATSVGAVLGTSTVTTYIESAAGISEGGKTGLTSMVTGVLFLLAIIIAPIAGIIPAAATAPALIIVGVLMMSAVRGINFDDFEEALPAFLTIAMMPFAYSIADGIASGFIFFTIVKMARGKFKEVHPIMYGLSVIFILRMALMAFYAG